MQVTVPLLRTIAAVLLALVSATAKVDAQESRLLGCYETSFSTWSSDSSFMKSRFFRIPLRVNLTAVRSVLASTDRVSYLMFAAPGVPESGFEDMTWSHDSTATSVLLRWFTPSFGLQARLTVVEQVSDVVKLLRGEVQQRSDHPPSAGGTATLTMTRVPCLGGV